MMQTHDEEGGEFSFTYNNLGKKNMDLLWDGF